MEPPTQDESGHPEFLRHSPDAANPNRLRHLGQIRAQLLRWPTAVDAAGLGGLQPAPRALEQLVAIPLREDEQQVHAGSTCGRRRIDRLVERDQADAAVRKALGEHDAVEHGSRESIEARDDEDVDAATVRKLQQLEQARPAHRGARFEFGVLDEFGVRPGVSCVFAKARELRADVLDLIARRAPGVDGDSH